MFRRLQLVNWGPFTAHEFNLHAPIIDLCGDNGAGKTTILDAFALVLGVEIVTNNRKFSHYQRDRNPAFVAVTVENPQRPSGRRAFVGHDAQFTVLARFDDAETPQRRFLILKGNMDVKEAIALSARAGTNTKWLAFKEYNAKWDAAGFPAKDRVNRTFSHKRPADIRESKPTALYQLFETFASDPEVNLKLAEARKSFDRADNDLMIATKNQENQRTRLLQLNNDLDEAKTYTGDVAEKERQRRLLKVATYQRLEAELQRQGDQRSTEEAARAKLVIEHQDLESRRPGLQQAVDTEKLQRDGHQKQFDEADERLNGIEEQRAQAFVDQERVESEKRELTKLQHLPPTTTIRSNLADLDKAAETRTRDVARIETLSEAASARRRALTEDGVPPQVLAAIDELRAEKVVFTEARTFLPSSEPQVFEDALGPLRFGILVKDAATQARTAQVLAKHRYPGPISTLSSDQYVKRTGSGWTPHGDGHSSELGVFVAQDFDPVLNRRLAAELVKTLDKQLAGFKAELKQHEAAAAEAAKKRSEFLGMLGQAQIRDGLVVKSKTWDDTLANCKDILLQYKQRKEHYDRVKGLLDGANARVTGATQRVGDLDKRLQEIGKLLKPVPQIAQELETQMREAFQECKEFLDPLKAEVISEKSHSTTFEKLERKLREAKVWTIDAIQATTKERDQLKLQNEKDAGRLTEKTTNLSTAKKNMVDLEEDQKNAIRKEFQAAKKRIEALAPALGFAAELNLKTDDEGRPALHYLVRFGHEHFVPISGEELSTGEGGIAAYAFCLGLSNPEQPGWYCLDEPSQNFDYGNTDNLFRILRQTNAQVIMTSPKDQDYGDQVDVLRYYLGQVKNKRAPQPEFFRVKTVVATP